MKKIIILIIIASCLFPACKRLVNPSPAFNVTAPSLTYKVGDTVKFALTGDANQITFYSGEPGFNYANINRTTAPVTASLTVSTALVAAGQANALHLMATQDTLIIDSAHVVNANWTDISSRVTFAPTSAAVVSTIDLSDFANGKPLTLAWKYVATTGAVQPTWFVVAFTLNSVVTGPPTQTISQLTIGNAAWFKVHVLSSPGIVSTSWNVYAASLQIITAAATTPSRLDWIVAKPVYLSRVTPDVGVGIKDLTAGAPLTTYSYIYKTAGTYTATFVGTNTIPGEAPKTEIKQLTFTVK